METKDISKLRFCNWNHPEIYFNTDDNIRCPVCGIEEKYASEVREAIELKDAAIDAQEDADAMSRQVGEKVSELEDKDARTPWPTMLPPFAADGRAE